eukprot:TRINITY_DN9483_c0_g1_i1.p1 TRINITY_DN9483_c0_g1~~TRINITY_DN9483_c0_g1_i1.p1  ORF type:complete len:446 (-),score=93.90 TRINITY_DN9483_c0_g1_i1:159-1496(-)
MKMPDTTFNTSIVDQSYVQRQKSNHFFLSAVVITFAIATGVLVYNQILPIHKTFIFPTTSQTAIPQYIEHNSDPNKISAALSEDGSRFWSRFKNKTVFILGADYAYLPLLLNHVLSLKRFGNYDFVMEAYDQQTYRFLTQVGFSVYRDLFNEKVANTLFSELDCGKGPGISPNDDLMERKVMYLRLHLYKVHLLLGLESLSLDTDSCWLQKPDSLLDDKSFDLSFVLQKGKTLAPGFSHRWVEGENTYYRLNPGLAIIRPSQKLINFYTKIYADSMIHLCDPGYAQAAVSRQLWKSGLRMSREDNHLRGTTSGLHIKTIPYELYTSACDQRRKAFIQSNLKRHAEDPISIHSKLADANTGRRNTTRRGSQHRKSTANQSEQSPFLVHSNCAFGVDNKIQFLESHGCWYLRPEWQEMASQSRSLADFLEKIDTRFAPSKPHTNTRT